jgi:sortase A
MTAVLSTAANPTAAPAAGSPAARLLRRLELGGILAGSALLLAFAGTRLHSEASRQSLLARFDAARLGQVASPPETTVDQSQWSEGRIAKYRDSLSRTFPPPLAVLRIPGIGLEVPVLEGTDDETLDRAVGHISGTAAPGEPGNVAIAGHRDGFFRALKDLKVGDALELETLAGKQQYDIETLTVVDPSDVQVLDPTPEPVLTLVTCYPFYFVGSAPQRFIVRAQARQASAGAEVRQRRSAATGSQ